MLIEQEIRELLCRFCWDEGHIQISQYSSEEDSSPYHVWKIQGKRKTAVLKQITPREREIYETFFSSGGGAVAEIYGYAAYKGHDYVLMEHISGETLSRCTRERLILALDALISLQDQFWEDRLHENIGYSFHECYSNRQKRLNFMGELAEAYSAYLEEFSMLPRTLCNDDLLPFNIIANSQRAVIIDWEFGGILPYLCSLSRFIAFGEDAEDALFQMSDLDKAFAVDYYYDKLIRGKGISYEEYLHTLKLFLFKEYSEWVYCANSSGEPSEYYEKYAQKARELACELGYIS